MRPRSIVIVAVILVTLIYVSVAFATKEKYYDVIMTPEDVIELADRVTDPYSDEHEAYDVLVTTKINPALTTTPTPVQESGHGDYPLLEAAGGRARDVAVGYAAVGSTTYRDYVIDMLMDWSASPANGGIEPVAYLEGTEGDAGQAAYHQSYGVVSFALAYSVVDNILTAEQDTQITAWFQAWANAYEDMMDMWATDYYFDHTSQGAYSWTTPPSPMLYRDTQDWYTGRDVTIAGLCGWLASAMVAQDTADMENILLSHRLNVSTVLDCAANPDNDGDNAYYDDVPAPDSQVGISNSDYLPYHARLAGILYQLAYEYHQHGGAVSWDDATALDNVEALFDYNNLWGTNQVMPQDGEYLDSFKFHSRMWVGRHLFGDSVTYEDDLYEKQMLGPTVLTQLQP